ncbi:Hypothetical protein, putative [Bodo saltans]|uniref:Uncharacterized protein n=1 Tax=Bodo saltans TaxID=75058 RepID=A0A0S4JQJ6_BODSA|nr:Hypothetical protein, putative [Bodo saltans]|eukprot:CUG93767.1 Hypothetical protein, putative [Bodo saltans]
MATLLHVVNAPLIAPVAITTLERSSHGCGVGRCRCSSFTLGETRRLTVVPVSTECICGHALMYHSKRVTTDNYSTPQAPHISSSTQLRDAEPSRLGHARLETALLHAHQAERVVELKLGKYRHACNPDSGADVAHAKHSLQEAFKISLRSLEDLGAARSQLTDTSEQATLMRHESVCVMRRLMECCEYAQRELSAAVVQEAAYPPTGLHPPRTLPQAAPRAVCPKCDEVLDPKLGKYCGNCGHSR